MIVSSSLEFIVLHSYSSHSSCLVTNLAIELSPVKLGPAERFCVFEKRTFQMMVVNT